MRDLVYKVLVWKVLIHFMEQGRRSALQAVARGPCYLTLCISPASVIPVNAIISPVSLPLLEAGEELPRQTPEFQERIFAVSLWE